MAIVSDIDELVEFSYKAVSLIRNDQSIMALIADDPNLDLDSDEAYQYEDRIKDHDYVDETSLTSNAYITVETAMLNLDTPSMKKMRVVVEIICQKTFMPVNQTKFQGMRGNRRDNLAMLVNNLLNNNTYYGVGDLKLLTAGIGSVPTGYTSRVLEYEAPCYASRREV